ncbi:sugar ABC transporter permease [Ktedonosporobacter rubrisoli]|uniref:Sugar ABC transporter permease n=1 Tax=Ktedonosporobacter rubrisoli TaxID=2509675 RepID=A0A4P6JQ31_KTERU|nr:sugar ABC transporter permease [Ktedonosporobacter rubrisoli]QBD76876.1 sugar ABC transporter permease [Ktedonosporobacter rubrisoli]
MQIQTTRAQAQPGAARVPTHGSERQHSNGLRKRLRDNRMFYLCIAPFFILFALFGAIPIAASFYLGFTRWDGLSQPIFVGFSNYLHLFQDPDFLKIMGNTFYIWLGSTILTMGLAFTLAFLINHYVLKGRSILQVIFLFPLLIAPSLTAIIVSALFSTNAGLLNAVISALIGHKFAYDWFASGAWLKPVLILIIVWRWTGWHLTLFISGLQSISNEIYEAARVDGATGSSIFRHITLPLMIPVILVSVVSATIGGIQLFDEPYVLTTTTGTGNIGGTSQLGMTLGLYQYQTAFQQFNFGLASAISYVIFILIIVFTIIQFRVLRNRN